MIVDSHQHFWAPGRGDYGWLAPGTPLARDFDPADLTPLLEDAGVDATILVQAAPTEAETDYLIVIARATPWVAGVIGWIDLAAPDAADRITARAGRLVGVRPMLQDLADPNWILAPRIDPGLRALAASGLAFDALIRAEQLDMATELAARHGELTIVIDHGAKPPLGDTAAMRDWTAAIARAAHRPNMRCKLSGLMTELPTGAPVDALAPIVSHILGSFGPGRVMWGSDWPVLTLAGEYRQWFDLARSMTAHLTPAEQAAIFGDNAIATYRFQSGEIE